METVTSPPEFKHTERIAVRTWDPPKSKSFGTVLSGLWKRLVDHHCTDVAGEAAFDFAFSIFPAALFAATLAGLLGITPEFVSNSLDVMGIFLHDTIRNMVEDNVRSLVESSSQQVLTIGLLGAVWASSSAISATQKAMNRAYGIKETRSFLYRRTQSLGLMLGVGLAMVIAFNLLVMGTWIETELLVRLRLQDVLPSLISYTKWPLGFLSAIMMAGLIYRMAPNCRPRLKEVLPGAVFFSILWFFLSKAFGSYVSNFGYYNKVTGVLGVFIVLLLWIYLTALILLIGGELNAELSHKEGQ